MGAKQPRKGESRRDLRAVDKRETFLGREHDRLEARLGKALGGRHLPRLERDVAFTDHGRGHVGEGRKIAGSADGALLRNDRDHAFFQHGFDQADEFRAHTGSAATERDQLQRHDEAYDIFRQRVPDAAAMGQDQIAL